MESINSITITLDVLRLLFQKARRWWYHQELRERGRIAEARRWERQSVRNNVERLAEARVLHIGRGGWCLYRDGRAWLEGHCGTLARWAPACGTILMQRRWRLSISLSRLP